jgi:hypothetical protein
MTHAPMKASTAAGRPYDPWLWGLLGLVFSVGLLSMPAVRYDGDVNAWEMEAESLIYEGRLAVRPSVAENISGQAPYFVFNATTGNWYSKYGIGNTLIYAIPLAFERFFLGQSGRTKPTDVFGESAGPYEIKRRLLLLNGFNIVLGVLLALVLYRLARFYTDRGLTGVLFVLACMYATYLWNYTRAQSSQIYQVLLFSMALLFFLRHVRGSNRHTSEASLKARSHSHDLLWSVLSLSALCLVKLVFAPLIGILVVAVALIGRNRPTHLVRHLAIDLRSNARTYLLYAAVPLLALCTVIVWVNDLKFGAPLKMGYERETNLFGASLLESVPAYLFAARYSIFVHFPPLVVALFGMPRMWKRHRAESLLVWALFFTMFLIYSSYTYWKAEASYGPRYLLFALPALSLPAVFVLDGLFDAKNSIRHTGAGMALATLMLGSLYAQTLVNRLEFHTFFRLRQQFQLANRNDPELGKYLRDTNTAVFNRDFLRYRDEGIIPVPMGRVKSSLSAARYRELEQSVAAHLKSNHYFW